jgi:hypothetical protein
VAIGEDGWGKEKSDSPSIIFHALHCWFREACRLCKSSQWIFFWAYHRGLIFISVITSRL